MSRKLRVPSTILLPQVLRWQQPDQPLPVRAVRLPPLRDSLASPGRKPGESRSGESCGSLRPRTLGLESPPWLDTGAVDQPFDFCGSIRRLCADIVHRCDELKHIDVGRLLFGMTQARSAQPHGLQARVTPLRFRNGELVRRRRGVAYQVQRYVVDDREMLYLVTFCLPRFLDQDFDDKFVTLFHELYHISPDFEGDLRRHEGRYALHSHSKRDYDVHMAELAREYLNSDPDRSLYSFLRLNFAQLQHRHGSVVAVVVPRPRLLPLSESA